MKRRHLVVVTILIPEREEPALGGSRPHPAWRWKTLQDELHRRYGGWNSPASRHGEWLDPDTGERVAEVCRVFEVDVPEAKVDEFRRFVGRIARTFVQKCIRVVILGRPEYIEAEESDEPL